LTQGSEGNDEAGVAVLLQAEQEVADVTAGGVGATAGCIAVRGMVLLQRAAGGRRRRKRQHRQQLEQGEQEQAREKAKEQTEAATTICRAYRRGRHGVYALL
jgi:hypothetical protein